MTRNYIGLSCTGHDNALAIVDSEGRVRYAEAGERYLQSKRSLAYAPDDLIRIPKLVDEYCDAEAELVLARSWSARAPRACERQRRALDAPPGFADNFDYVLGLIRRSHEAAGANLLYRCRTDLRRPTSVRDYPHHLTHAAFACYSSPFDEAACAIVDGYGEGGSVAFYHFADGRLRRVDRPDPAPDMMSSLGVFYGMLCNCCGFDIWKGEEWKVMGLAPYGASDPHLEALLRRILRARGLRLEFPREGRQAILELFQHARKPGAPVLDAADLAHTGQQVFGDLMVSLLEELRALDLSENLVLSGGCALNSACNGRIPERTGFDALHVPCAPADDGNAVGAALLAFCEDHPDQRPERAESPYLGSRLCAKTLARLDRSRLPGLRRPAEGVHRRAATLLAEGRIIGWVRGRAEFGPRALGNRSILSDPRAPDMKQRINALVKFRESFRPFAPAILHEYGPEYFEDYRESRYMERALRFRRCTDGMLPAVQHVDGTGRLQTVKREWNEDFYRLIQEFHRITGTPVLLNTSFNVMGKPIIHSVEDALAVLFTTGLDAVVLEDRIVEKPS